MGVEESIGTVMRVSATLPATYDASGYAALSPSAVGEITGIPEFGGQAATVEHTPLADGIVQKFHGAINYGSLSVPLALDIADAGQVILAAAFASRNRIAFEIETPDGAFMYFSGKVMSQVKRSASTTGVISGTVMVEIETPVIDVAA